MADNYPGISQWGLSVPIVTDDSLRDASEYSAGQVALTDRTEYLKGQGFYSTPSFGGTYTNVGTYRIQGDIILTLESSEVRFGAYHSYTRVVEPIPWFKSARWAPGFNSIPIAVGYLQLTHDIVLNSDDGLIFSFLVPDSAYVTNLTVKLAPNVLHGPTLPSGMPTVTVYRGDVSTNTFLLLGSETDLSPDVATYINPHDIEIALPTTFVETGKHFLLVKITGEYGATADDGMIVYPPIITFTRSKLGDEMGDLVPSP